MPRSFVSLLILAVFAPNAYAEPVEAGLALGLSGAVSPAEPRIVASTAGNAAAAIDPEAPQAPAVTDGAAEGTPAPTDPAPTEADPAPFVRHFGVQYSAGSASFIGDLRGPDVVFVQDIQAKVLHVSTLEDHLRYYLAIDVLITGAEAEGGAFLGYPDGAELKVLSFLFIPMVCGAPNAALQVCCGIGQGTVNVNAARDRRDWGTWNYQAQLDVSPRPWLQFFALGKFVGAIEQQVDGVDSEFSFYTLTGGAGLTF